MNVKRNRIPLALLGAAIALSTGCRHHNQAIVVPPPPPLQPQAARRAVVVADSRADREFIDSHTPIYSEEGLASWYGPPYDKRRGANGEIYDEHALTAAHRTLPLNSLIEVTNLSTGQAAILRVTDRGPFIPGRELDLSLAAAKAIDVWRPGVARVRIDVYAAPSPLDRGGRWCVQVGAFRKKNEAVELRDHLQREYRMANVIEFSGPTGYWVRIRPPEDDRSQASEIARLLKPSEGTAFLVRLD